MSRRPRRLLAVAAVVATTAGLAGCGSEPAAEGSGAVAFVVGARSNMPPVQLAGRALDVLDRAVEDQSLAVIVVADGEPDVLGSAEMLMEGQNDTARTQSQQENRQSLADGLSAARAEDDETDLLTAIDEGARSIRSVESNPHTLVVVDSGLSTVAPLDFTRPGLLEADPQEVVDYLSGAGALPDLAGMDVVLQGIGDTAAPQQDLSIAQRGNLVAIWEAVLLAAGASDVVVEDSPLSGEAEVGLPYVSVVELPEAVACTPGRVELSGGDVAFEADSAVFRDRQAAEAILRPIAGQMVENGYTALVTGTRADVGDLEGQKTLSRERAEAVRGVLVGLGVPEVALTPEGLGSEFPGYVQDHTADGALDPVAAAANRKVVITLSGTVSC